MFTKGILTGLAALVVGIAPTSAHADPAPDSTELITLDCGSGPEMIAIPGRGNWTPALVMGSNVVHHPVAFGPAQYRVSDSEGNLVGDPQVDDTVITRQGQRTGQGTLDCTFIATHQESGLTYEFSMTVTVKS